MREKDTLDFLGLWQLLNNPYFKPVKFEGLKIQAGSNAITMSPQNGLAERMPLESSPKEVKFWREFHYLGN